MTLVLSAKVSEDVKRRVATYAKSRGMMHPSRRPNLSAATREILERGLQTIEARGKEPRRAKMDC